jgi:hypothetical protein
MSVSGNPSTWVPFIALGVSGAALLVASVSLWRSQLAPMRLLFAPGPITLRIAQFGSDTKTWFVADAAVDITFTNVGAKPGTVRDLRLRIDYPGLSIPSAHEYFELTAEVDPSEFSKSPNRPAWLRSARVSAGAPFILLPKESQAKRLIFMIRWDKPIDQTFIHFWLEAFTDRSKEWVTHCSWRLRLRSDIWQHLTRGGAVSQYPDGYPRRHKVCHPANLHEYTDQPSGVEPDDLDNGYLV